MQKGFTLIELMIALFIAAIIISICSDIYIRNIKNMKYIEGNVDDRANARIALDFISDKLRDAQSIVIGSGYVVVDGKKIYVKSSILRIDTDSQQIVNNVSAFYVEKVGEANLYKINISIGTNYVNALIKNRG